MLIPYTGIMPVLLAGPAPTTSSTPAPQPTVTPTAPPVSSSSGVLSIAPTDGQSTSPMTVEQAMLQVQMDRVGQLDQIVTAQAQEIHNRNDTVAKLNTALSLLTAIQAKFNSDAKATDQIGSGAALNADGNWAQEKEVNTALMAAGVNNLFTTALASYTPDGQGGFNHDPNYLVCSLRTKGDIDGAISKIKSTIDSLSNLQQMDTLRLQSVMNKRNEGFDVMSDLVKKNSDSLDSIIRNMA